VLGLAHAALLLNKMAKQRRGLVATIGYAAVKPNVANVIPAEATFTVDTRHHDAAVLRQFIKLYRRRLGAACRRLGLELNMKMRSSHPATRLSSRVARVIEDVCRELRVKHMRMVSGAGHDSMNVAKITNAAMIFVPSVKGISHSPREFTKKKDVVNGATVLLNTLLKLANE